MTKVRSLIGFNAFNITVSSGEVFEIKDNRGIQNDLERLGWIEPLEHEVTIDGVKKTKTASI